MAAPVCPAAGLNVTVRLLPLPPNTMFLAGIKVGFEVVASSCRMSGIFSASAIVN
jgi:hypothetical protein